MRTRTMVLISSLVVVLLAAATTLAIAATRHYDGSARFAGPHSGTTSCTVPNLPGTTVNVSLMNAGMTGGGGMMGSGWMMRLTASPSSVTAGEVSFVATNVGSVNHEFLVLPLANNQIVGTRRIQADGKVDETGSLAEASSTCTAGQGDGIAPGASSWVSVTLRPGRYELVCNLPGHYAAGMYTQLTVV